METNGVKNKKHFQILYGLFLTGCMESEWHDASNNWSRTYNSQKPDSVRLVHSHYWQSGHCTLEYSFHFESAPNEDLENGLIKRNELLQQTQNSPQPSFYGINTPEWFAPKDERYYSIWIPKETTHNFTLLIDVETQHLFWTETQL